MTDIWRYCLKENKRRSQTDYRSIFLSFRKDMKYNRPYSNSSDHLHKYFCSLIYWFLSTLVSLRQLLQVHSTSRSQIDFLVMVVKISGISQLILQSAVLVLKMNLAACHMCTLDDPSYKYCHSVQAQSADISNRTDQVYSIYQCRDNCDRQLCLAFDYQVDASQNMKNCTLFLGKSTDETSLKSSSDCNGTKWWYAWLREGRGRIWDQNCHASRGNFEL